MPEYSVLLRYTYSSVGSQMGRCLFRLGGHLCDFDTQLEDYNPQPDSQEEDSIA